MCLFWFFLIFFCWRTYDFGVRQFVLSLRIIEYHEELKVTGPSAERKQFADAAGPMLELRFILSSDQNKSGDKHLIILTFCWWLINARFHSILNWPFFLSNFSVLDTQCSVETLPAVTYISVEPNPRQRFWSMHHNMLELAEVCILWDNCFKNCYSQNGSSV